MQERVTMTVGTAGLLACGAAEAMVDDDSCWSTDAAHAVARMVPKLLTGDLENLAGVVSESDQPHWRDVYDAAVAEMDRRAANVTRR